MKLDFWVTPLLFLFLLSLIVTGGGVHLSLHHHPISLGRDAGQEEAPGGLSCGRYDGVAVQDGQSKLKLYSS